MDFNSLMAIAAQNQNKASKELEQKRREREANKPPPLPSLPARRPMVSSASTKYAAASATSAVSVQREQPRAPPPNSTLLPKRRDRSEKLGKAVLETGNGKTKGGAQEIPADVKKTHTKEAQEQRKGFEKASKRSSDSTGNVGSLPESGRTAFTSQPASDKAGECDVRERRTPSGVQGKRTGSLDGTPSRSVTTSTSHGKLNRIGALNTKQGTSSSKTHPRGPPKPMSFSNLMKIAEQQKNQSDCSVEEEAVPKTRDDQPVGRQLIEGRPRTSLPGKSASPAVCHSSLPSKQRAPSNLPSGLLSSGCSAKEKAPIPQQATDRHVRTANELLKPPSLQMTNLPWEGTAKSNGKHSFSPGLTKKPPVEKGKGGDVTNSTSLVGKEQQLVQTFQNSKKGQSCKEDVPKERSHEASTDRPVQSKSSSAQPGPSKVNKGIDLVSSRKCHRPPFMEDDWSDDDFADSEEVDVSKYIRKIFGYDRRRFANEDPRDLPMESNFANVLAEERRSARLGRKEDLEEEMHSEALEPGAAKKKKMRARPKRL